MSGSKQQKSYHQKNSSLDNNYKKDLDIHSLCLLGEISSYNKQKLLKKKTVEQNEISKVQEDKEKYYQIIDAKKNEIILLKEDLIDKNKVVDHYKRELDNLKENYYKLIRDKSSLENDNENKETFIDMIAELENNLKIANGKNLQLKKLVNKYREQYEECFELLKFSQGFTSKTHSEWN